VAVAPATRAYLGSACQLPEGEGGLILTIDEHLDRLSLWTEEVNSTQETGNILP
jgi:hypothetical protein